MPAKVSWSFTQGGDAPERGTLTFGTPLWASLWSLLRASPNGFSSRNRAPLLTGRMPGTSSTTATWSPN